MGAQPDEVRAFEVHGAEDSVEWMHGDLGWLVYEPPTPCQGASATCRHSNAESRSCRRPSRRRSGRMPTWPPRTSQFLDLISEDNRLNVYAGRLEVRPPAAPTTAGVRGSVS